MYSIEKLHCRKNIAMLPSPEGKYTVGLFLTLHQGGPWFYYPTDMMVMI